MKQTTSKITRREFLRRSGVGVLATVAVTTVGGSWFTRLIDRLFKPVPEKTGEPIIPEVKLATRPTIKLSEIRNRRYYLVDRDEERERELMRGRAQLAELMVKPEVCSLTYADFGSF